MRFQTILPFYYIDVGPKIQYFLLCDSLPEERALREELQRKRLVSALLMIYSYQERCILESCWLFD